jgi:hypothetical protein
MSKNKFPYLLIVAAFVLCTAGTAVGNIPLQGSTAPTLKLAVTQSPLALYPIIMIYKAQLSPMPTTSTATLKVDFYNLASTGYVLIGSAALDRTGVATLSKQTKAGTYMAIARVVINTKVIWSNSVIYKVP